MQQTTWNPLNTSELPTIAQYTVNWKSLVSLQSCKLFQLTKDFQFYTTLPQTVAWRYHILPHPAANHLHPPARHLATHRSCTKEVQLTREREQLSLPFPLSNQRIGDFVSTEEPVAMEAHSALTERSREEIPLSTSRWSWKHDPWSTPTPLYHSIVWIVPCQIGGWDWPISYSDDITCGLFD